jgi:hypothetical protein
MSKPKFEELLPEDGFILLMAMVRIIADAGCRGIDEYAQATDRTPFELWPEFCAAAGVDECEPWRGYPSEIDGVEQLEKKWRGHPLNRATGVYLEMWKEYQARQQRRN